jgi:hypothetical protein
MATLFDYLLWRGDLSFRASPFNEVDNLILAELSFVDFAEILPSDPSASMTLRDAAEIYFSAERETQSALLVPEAVPLLRAAAETERFSSLYLCGFERRTDAQCEAQFAAITFLLPDGEMFIAFRGTDDSLVGWKEDFNMAFLSVIPSQSSAMLYVDRMAATYPAYRIRIGGHSKGGNLAVYSAAKCASVHRERIIRVYNNDGPGFSRAFLDSEGYTAIKDRIHTILPETSVVGMLLEQEGPYTVIKSRQNGIFQHDAFSWEVEGRSFIRVEDRSEGSKILDRTFKAWIAAFTEEEREEFVDTVYQLISSATDAETLPELLLDREAPIRLLKNLTPERRDTIAKMLRVLIREGRRAYKEGKLHKNGEKETLGEEPSGTGGDAPPEVQDNAPSGHRAKPKKIGESIPALSIRFKTVTPERPTKEEQEENPPYHEEDLY